MITCYYNVINSTFLVILQNNNSYVLDDEELYHPQMSEYEAAVAANCAEGFCDEIPSTQKLDLKVMINF